MIDHRRKQHTGGVPDWKFLTDFLSQYKHVFLRRQGHNEQKGERGEITKNATGGAI